MNTELSHHQKLELTADLELLQLKISDELIQTTDNAKPVSLDSPIGRVSRMDAINMQHMAVAARERNRQRLDQIHAALQRLAAGTYGMCLLCEESIEFARLKSQPESALCRNCQQQREQKE